VTGFSVRRATRPRLRLAGPLRLAGRLAARDLRRRPATGLLLLVALTAATTTMTLALVVRGSAEAPWDQTFAATDGPHIAATTFDADDATASAMADLAAAPEVVARAGPFPLLAMPDGSLRASGHGIDVEVMARDSTPAAVDQPALITGEWIREGGVVVEESFATALGVAVGDRLTMAGAPFTVAGIAVTTSRQPTPFYTHGLVWATRADAGTLAPAAESRGEVLMLRLADPDQAPAFAAAHATGPDHLFVDDWQSTRLDALTDVLFAQFGLIVGAVALALLAAASVAVAVAGRMAAQTRRSAVLKAAGATPRFVATVALAGYLTFALAAGVAGLVAGTYLAPLLARPVDGVLGTATVALPSGVIAALVPAAAVALVALATVAPIRRSVRRSTIRALADPARPPRRSRLAVAVSARLPVPLLLGLRLAARRPGRAVLSAAAVRDRGRHSGGTVDGGRDQRGHRPGRRGSRRARRDLRQAAPGHLHLHRRAGGAGPGQRHHRGLDERGGQLPQLGAGPGARCHAAASGRRAHRRQPAAGRGRGRRRHPGRVRRVLHGGGCRRQREQQPHTRRRGAAGPAAGHAGGGLDPHRRPQPPGQPASRRRRTPYGVTAAPGLDRQSVMPGARTGRSSLDSGQRMTLPQKVFGTLRLGPGQAWAITAIRRGRRHSLGWWCHSGRHARRRSWMEELWTSPSCWSICTTGSRSTCGTRWPG
jgi:putative ABC transport system permease protein